MAIKLFNTPSHKKEIFKPIKAGQVRIYSCGPTVYWNQHIGNMYAYIQWDVLVRFFKYLRYKVKWVMNITDVGHMTSDQDAGEDKMEKGARREGLSVWKIAEKYINQFLESIVLLNIQKPNVLCRATEHIKEQIDLIKKIEKNGFVYQTKTGLVFNTSKFPGYSKFARLNLKKQYAGSRVKVDAEKKQPWDFLLWVTNQPHHIMQWDSPWGKGFPGWHVECTTMSIKYLGNHFDIHTGGREHIPVHHTNEIAQAYGAFGKQTANYWLHNEWLLIEKTKVSKSLGNIILVTDFIQKGFNPLALRYLVLTSHYRQGLNFTWEGLKAAQIALNKICDAISSFETRGGKVNKEYKEKFLSFLSDDLNMPKALSLVWQLIKDKKVKEADKKKTLLDFDYILGLDLAKVKKLIIPSPVKKLAEKREKLRKEKKWKEADKIRKDIEKQGFKIEDTKKGPEIKSL